MDPTVLKNMIYGYCDVLKDYLSNYELDDWNISEATFIDSAAEKLSIIKSSLIDLDNTSVESEDLIDMLEGICEDLHEYDIDPDKPVSNSFPIASCGEHIEVFMR